MRCALLLTLATLVACEDDGVSPARSADFDVDAVHIDRDAAPEADRPALTPGADADVDAVDIEPDAEPDANVDAVNMEPDGAPEADVDAVDIEPDAEPDAESDANVDAVHIELDGAPEADVDAVDIEPDAEPDADVDAVNIEPDGAPDADVDAVDIEPDGAPEPGPFEPTCELLENGGAEAGDLSGWRVEAGEFEARGEEARRIPAPFAGERLFFAGQAGRSRLVQDVPVHGWAEQVEAEAMFASVRGQLRTWSGSDRARLELHALDGEGAVVGSVVGDLHGADAWRARRVDLAVPRGTVALRAVLHGERRSGQDNDAYFDDIELCLDDAPPPAPPADGRVAPYLMWVTQDAVSVLWETAEASVGSVQVEGGERFEEAEPKRVHELRLTGLEPATEYTYVAGQEGRVFPPATFRTAPDGPAPFDFVVWGDNQNGPENFERVVDRMLDEAPHWAASTGDCVQWGLEDLYRNELFRPLAPLAASTPFLVAAGNHERLIDFGGNLFDRYMSQPGDEHCFGYPYGDAYFVFVDTELSVREGSPQYGCIDDALGSEAAQAASLRAVLFHKPPRVEYWAGFCYTGERDVRDHLEPLFAAHGVDVVFNGHNHLYAYTPPGDDGITWVTTGGGGGVIDDEDDFCRRWDEITETHFVHHFLAVHVEDGTMQVRAIDIDGIELHRFQVPPARDP